MIKSDIFLQFFAKKKLTIQGQKVQTKIMQKKKL